MRLFSPPALFLLLFFTLLAPEWAQAADISYTSVQVVQGEEVKLRRATLTGENWYLCAVDTRACEAVSSTTPFSQPPTPQETPQIPWTALPAGASRVTLSPDGRWVAFYIAATQSRGKRTWGVHDTATGKTFTKGEEVAYWDLLTEGVRAFAFSPDSRTLIYINDTQNHPTLYKVDLAAQIGSTLASSKMFSREYSVADVQFANNERILFIANRESPHQWSLYDYALSTGVLTRVADHVSYGVPLRKASDYFLFAEAGSQGVRSRLYNPETRAVLDFALPQAPVLETSGKEVTTLLNDLSGVFLLEKSGNSKTLLVWLHGGPYRQSSIGYHPYLSYNSYDWALELARRADVGVLKIDYPGSMGYGRPFAESVMLKVGVKDAQDTAEAVADFARRNGYTDIYLMGNSYGGYLAMKMLVDNPTRYKGAMSIGGVADWTTLLGNLSDSIFNVQFGGIADAENDNFGVHAAASIYNKLGNLSGQKVVLVHGDGDMTIPYRQAEGLAQYARSINKPVELVTFEDEDHVFKNKESFEKLCQTTLTLVGRTDTTSCAL